MSRKADHLQRERATIRIVHTLQVSPKGVPRVGWGPRRASMKRPTVSRVVHGVGSPWWAWVLGLCDKPASSTLLSALFEGPAWRAVHDGGSDGEGGAAIFATASARNACRACPSAAVALSRSGDWLVHKTMSLEAFPGFLFFSYPAPCSFDVDPALDPVSAATPRGHAPSPGTVGTPRPSPTCGGG